MKKIKMGPISVVTLNSSFYYYNKYFNESNLLKLSYPRIQSISWEIVKSEFVKSNRI